MTQTEFDSRTFGIAQRRHVHRPRLGHALRAPFRLSGEGNPNAGKGKSGSFCIGGIDARQRLVLKYARVGHIGGVAVGRERNRKRHPADTDRRNTAPFFASTIATRKFA